MRWSDVRAIEIVVDKIADEQFDGEDPLRPVVRSALDDCRRQLSEVHACAQSDLGDFELSEPRSQVVDQLRQSVQAAARRQRGSKWA